MAVIVVTDSSSTLPSDVVAQNNIRVVPLHVLHNGNDLREGVDEIPSAVWRSNGVSTAGASPEELREVFDKAVRDSGGDGVVGIFLSRKLSSTWEAAHQAASDIGSAVRVVDSRAAAFSLAFVVQAAAVAANRGATRDEVYDTAVDAANRTSSFVYVNQLDNLRRGGRIGAASALLGTALAIKPVLQLEDGALGIREKTRTATKAINRLIDISVETARQKEHVSIAVQHLEAEDRARDVLARVTARLEGFHATYITDLGAVLGVHLGPGAISVSMFARREF
ncbi:DegV family protein [Hoyosella rhizosphaerae]|uniref:DegV family protein n=1 Tax=Hoyosella rhizosphaerae TaxID=1755582 RepID=A0A916UHJ2_9ACTN|nr:DegV family protein [Hoyosella rhizosphaerae]MBN4928071.1 DegV family protein [Hoyosella rhizosphaerae]GGC72160.1 hypothetical protein GCM10011410_26500 [Hoyosella rhizosphaerae]